MNGWLIGLLVWILVFAGATPALAWCDMGHRIICEIAFQEPEPAAREHVEAMIRRDPEFDTFAEVLQLAAFRALGWGSWPPDWRIGRAGIDGQT